MISKSDASSGSRGFPFLPYRGEFAPQRRPSLVFQQGDGSLFQKLRRIGWQLRARLCQGTVLLLVSGARDAPGPDHVLSLTRRVTELQ